MKINETQRIGAIHSYQRNADSRNGNVNKKGRQLDEVLISPEAKEMLQSQIGDKERNGRIETLKKSVATGTYHVDANKIAEKMLPYFK